MPERGARPNVHPVQRRVLRVLAALSSPLLPDDYLELVNPLWSTRELRGRVERIEAETPDAATVLIKPGYRWGGHEAGQYLRIGLDIEGVRHWRAYSLTSDPARPDGLISITVKNVDEGKVSPYLVRRGRPGTIVSLGGVEGEFVLPDPLPEKLLFISAGSGITPIMSMLRHLDRRRARRRRAPAFGAPGRRGDLRGRAARAGPAPPEVRPARAAHRRSGPDGPGRPRRAVPRLARARDLHLRPPDMLDAFGEHFEAADLEERLHMERFQPKLGLGDGDEGEGGTIKFWSPTRGRVRRKRPDPGRREEAAICPTAAARASATPASASCAPGGARPAHRQGAGEEGEVIRTCIHAPEGPIEIEL